MSNKPFLGMLPSTWVFSCLIALTFITFFLGQSEISGLWVTLIILGIAMLKGHLVGAYFMGLGRLRGPWRWPVTVWLIIPGSLIATAFILSN